MLRDVVDGSNESLYHPNEENYTHFPPRSPSERISELDGVVMNVFTRNNYEDE